MSEIEPLLTANKNLSKKLSKLKDVEWELHLAREKIQQQRSMIDDLRQIKLKIDCVWVHKDDIRYALQITDILEGPNGVIIEGSL